MKFDFQPLLYLALASVLTGGSQAVAVPAPRDAPTSNLTLEARVDDGVWGRPVCLVLDRIEKDGFRVSDNSAETFYTHSSVHYGRYGNENPFRVEIIDFSSVIEMEPYAIRALDLGADDRGISPQGRPGTKRFVYELPQRTDLTNNQLLDPSTGKGLVLDVWVRDPAYRAGVVGHRVATNDCNVFAFHLLQATFRKGFIVDPEALQRLQGGITYSAYSDELVNRRIRLFLHTTRAPGQTTSTAADDTIYFDIADPANIRRLSLKNIGKEEPEEEEEARDPAPSRLRTPVFCRYCGREQQQRRKR